jgi:hypothetical protein
MTAPVKRFGWTMAAGAAVAIVVAISAQGQGRVAPGLEGTWRVEVVQENGPPLKAFHTFSAGGAMMESNNGGPAPGHGVWQRTGGRTFAHTFEKYIFDPNLPFVKVRVREVIEVDHDFEGYTGRGQVLLFDAAGNQIASDCARTRATRMNLEAPTCP